MKIKNAIIIHGPGRSGTTLLNSILALHEDLAWISGYTNKYPEKLWLSNFNKLQGYSNFERFNRGKRRYPRPAEAYNFWLHHVPEFNKKEIDIISKVSASKAIEAISKIINYSGKQRFITKLTGNSRYQTIDKVFDNPNIVWIDRDPKAVIMSYYKQRWNYKSDPEKFESIPKKQLLHEYYSLYRSFQEEKRNLEKFNLETFYYEDLVKDKHEFFQKICQFVGLEYTETFERLVESWKILEGTNISYKKYITEEEEAYLNELIAKQ